MQAHPILGNLADLAPRQRETLVAILEHWTVHGCPPTLREIGAKLGVTSPNGIRNHLKRLEDRGHIELVAGDSRGIRLKGIRWEPVAMV